MASAASCVWTTNAPKNADPRVRVGMLSCGRSDGRIGWTNGSVAGTGGAGVVESLQKPGIARS